MKVRVLGCSGGIGGRHLRTTSLLVDHDVLVDAGTGVTDLSLDELVAIDHVFITHAHLDHIAALPLMIDSVADRRSTPVTVHASAATLDTLRKHVFNWSIWPDFCAIPTHEQAAMQYHTVEVGQAVRLGGRTFTALPAEHSVPAVGYLLDSGVASLAFTGDTTVNAALWPVLNRVARLRYLIVEAAFSNRERALACNSKHLCPSLLAEELALLEANPEVFITHLKPGQIGLIMSEIEDCIGRFKAQVLQTNQVFEF